HKSVQKNPVLAETSDEMPVKYLGFAVGQELAKEILGYQGGISKNLNELAGRVNEKRLYWVWGSTFVKTMIDLVPKDYFYAGQAPGILSTYSDPLAGNLSCGIYFARFALSFGLLFKHTIRHPWMSAEEANMPWTERFLTQWEQRKFGLLNDSIWGTANLLSFIWLNSKHSLSVWGDALTVVLLIFDVSVAIWDFEEQKTKYNKEMLQYNKDIERLNDDIHEMNHQIGMNEQEQKAKVHQIQMQTNVLKRAQAKCEREWQLQKITLITNISYAVGLTLTFIALTMPFVPLSAPVAATLALVGAVVCLAFTVINNAIKGGLEIHRTRHTLKDLEKDYNAYVLKFRETPEGMERKLLFLEIKKLDAGTELQKDMIVYQSLSLVRSIMLEVCTPAIIFASLIFLPLGVGAIPIGAALAMAIATHFMIDALFKPEERKELAPFNDLEYEGFCKFTNQLNPEKSSEKTKFSFFKSPVKDNLKDDSNDLDYLPSKE
ncbi:MAG: hypothetical protein HYX60_04715, partial [Legionella longbeachae]|nr:hypothetical protein [Legionella longbeachae]